ncbi:MAG: hypothetical protein LBH76_10960, partial [Propionibacteriaceae bacterium]|nr:hypothetical protein [Propionibacteriaceae bacterium]
SAVTLSGSVYSISASGFTPGEAVSGMVYSEPFSIGTVTADERGQVSFSWTMPDTASPGQHRVVLTGAFGTVEQVFTYGGALVGTGPSPALAPMALGGVLLVAMAAVGLWFGARRRPAGPAIRPPRAV